MRARPQTPSAAGTNDRLKLSLAFLLLALAVAVAYANSLKVDFIYDDYAFVYDNEAIRTFSPVSKFLLSQEAFSQPTNDHVYRPLASFTFALNYALNGLEPFGYHIFNSLFHVFNVFLVFVLLRRLGFQHGPSFAGALVFAIHPVHTEAVTWIAGRGNVLFLFFFLGAYLLYITADSHSKGQRLVLLAGSVAAYGLSLLAKEMAMPLPALLIGHDLYFHRGWSRKQRFRNAWIYLPYAATALCYILLRAHVVGKVAQVAYHGGSAYVTFLVMLKALALYARLLFLPVGLSLSRLFQPIYSIRDMAVFPSFCLVTLAVGICLFTFRRSPRFSFGLFWFAVTMLPVSNIIPVNAIVADRFLYGPSIGFCIIIAVWSAHLAGSAKLRGLLTTTVLVAAGFFFMLLSINRNAEWGNAVLLWSKTAKAFPESFAAFNNLGFEYMRRGRVAEAIDALNKCVEIKDDLPEAHLNLASCHEKTGNLNMAIHHFNAALPHLDTKAETRYRLGLLLERRGTVNRAIAEYEGAVKENPDLVDAHRHLAALYKTRDIERAITHYTSITALAPKDADAPYQLALLYYRQGNLPKATGALRKSLSIDPHNRLALDLLERIEENSASGTDKISD